VYCTVQAQGREGAVGPQRRGAGLSTAWLLVGGLFRRGCGAPGSTKIGRSNLATTTDVYAYPPCRMTARVTRCSHPPSSTRTASFFSAGQAMRLSGCPSLAPCAAPRRRVLHANLRPRSAVVSNMGPAMDAKQVRPRAQHPDPPRPCPAEQTGPGSQIPPSFFRRRAICCPHCCHERLRTCPAFARLSTACSVGQQALDHGAGQVDRVACSPSPP
jgi:hypothetical protein